MNKKTKKRMTTVIIFLFFLAGGLWYGIAGGGFRQEVKETGSVVSVLATGQPEATSTPEASGVSEEKDAAEQTAELVVYVCGAVNQPGIYRLPENSRLYEAIALAGGFSADADPAYHNLARSISDGERIYILNSEETQKLTTEQQAAGESGAVASQNGLPVNLNTATAEQLTTLPGIGEAKAESILEYRAKIGAFTAIEEIMNVSGIGEAMFEKIKDKITVK